MDALVAEANYHLEKAKQHGANPVKKVANLAPPYAARATRRAATYQKFVSSPKNTAIEKRRLPSLRRRRAVAPKESELGPGPLSAQP